MGTAFLLLSFEITTKKADEPPGVEPGTNVYEGYGDSQYASAANLRRADDNDAIDSSTIGNLTQKCKVNIANLFGLDYFNTTRMGGGSLSTMQVSETHAYTYFYDTRVTGEILEPVLSSVISINRDTCAVDWIANITDVSTKAAKILLAKYPDDYNATLVETFVRSDTDGPCFSPITLYKDFIITGDGCIGNYFFSDAYYESRPQDNGGPILGKTWGITKNERHHMNGHIYVLNAKTGDLLDADRLADSCESEAQGYCGVEALGRMTQVVYDEVDDATYVFAGTSNPFRRGKYTRIDNDEERFNIGILNGNREVRKGGILKRFRLYPDGTIEETWRTYGSPPALFAGDQNPYNASHVFATDDEAEQYNYHNDGLWSIPMIDLDRRHVCISGGNGLMMPAEMIITAVNATGTFNPIDGSQGYPHRTYLDWMTLFNAATTVKEQTALYNDFKQTQKDRLAAMSAVPGNRFDDYFANSFTVLDFDTGTRKWQHKRIMTDTWISLTRQLHTFSSLEPYPYQRALYLGGGGDQDYPMGGLHIMPTEGGDDYYIVAAKDGSVQIFDPDTGDVIADTKHLIGQVFGAINYGGTVDNNWNMHFNGAWHRILEFLGDIAHISKFNATTGEITVDPNPECTFPWDLCLTNGTWHSNAFLDTFDDLGGGAGQFYLNQDTELPLGAGLLFKVNVPNANIAITASREDTDERIGATGHAVLTTVNDILIATNHMGRIEFWDPVSMQKIMEIDLLPDVAGLPYHPGRLVCENGVAPAGNEIWFTCGGNFPGEGPGAFVYSYSV
jgi:outer membrane protein assembly factor BamB